MAIGWFEPQLQPKSGPTAEIPLCTGYTSQCMSVNPTAETEAAANADSGKLHPIVHGRQAAAPTCQILRRVTWHDEQAHHPLKAPKQEVATRFRALCEWLPYHRPRHAKATRLPILGCSRDAILAGLHQFFLAQAVEVALL